MLFRPLSESGGDQLPKVVHLGDADSDADPVAVDLLIRLFYALPTVAEVESFGTMEICALAWSLGWEEAAVCSHWLSSKCLSCV